MSTVAICSFRLGGTDGVSIVAGHWARSFERLGWDVVTVAGSGPVDRTIAGLGLDGDEAPEQEAVEAALADADLVVVENLLTIPMNLPASRVVARVLAGRPAVLHHHDPPWQRERYSHISELPVDDAAWVHVTINDLTRAQMDDRGIRTTTIWNAFDVGEPTGDREATRRALGIAVDERLVVHPVRAIARKDVPAAIALTHRLGATYWLMGPAEEGYAPELRRILDAAPVRVVHEPSPGTMADAYAACDLVAFTSSWEGFGNPPIEAAIHRRPAAVARYPVAIEVERFGFRWFDPNDVEGIGAFLDRPDPEFLEHNRAVAAQHFSLERLDRDLDELLVRFGTAVPRPH